MTLAETKAALEALPGVHEVTEFIVRDDLGKPEYVRFNVHCTNPDLLETLRSIQENLERDLDYMVMVFIKLKFDKS